MLAVASPVATLTVLSLAGPPWGSRPRRCALTNRTPLRWPSPTVPGLRLGLSQGQPEKELFCRQGELFAISRPSLALSLKEGWGLCHQTCRRGCFHPGSSKLERPPAQPSRSCPHGHAPASRASGLVAAVSLIVTSGASDAAVSLWAWPLGPWAGARLVHGSQDHSQRHSGGPVSSWPLGGFAHPLLSGCRLPAGGLAWGRGQCPSHRHLPGQGQCQALRSVP